MFWQENKYCRKIVCLFMALMFIVSSPGPVYAQGSAGLPAAGVRLALSPVFTPPLLKGIKVYVNEPFRLDFILDKGEAEQTKEQLTIESSRMIKYFLASLTVPEKDLWVNLSPYEKDRIVPEAFGQTEMGRDLLAQDYILKQLTASMIYPEGETGKKFWKQVYAKAYEKYGTTNIPLDTFNKVWIMPEKAEVFENKDRAFIVESRLKVMLESDYLAMSHAPDQGDMKSDISKQVLKEVVIPILEKEVNEGKNFAQLRQVYQSLILATWYKRKIKDSIMSQAYVDKQKTSGIDIADKQEKEKIWAQYVDAFKKGAFNFIKEEQDVYSQEVIPRKYFSGGMSMEIPVMGTVHDPARLPLIPGASRVEVKLNTLDNDHAMKVSGLLGKVLDSAFVRAVRDVFGNKIQEEAGVVLIVSEEEMERLVNKQVEALILKNKEIVQKGSKRNLGSPERIKVEMAKRVEQKKKIAGKISERALLRAKQELLARKGFGRGDLLRMRGADELMHFYTYLRLGAITFDPRLNPEQVAVGFGYGKGFGPLYTEVLSYLRPRSSYAEQLAAVEAILEENGKSLSARSGLEELSEYLWTIKRGWRQIGTGVPGAQIGEEYGYYSLGFARLYDEFIEKYNARIKTGNAADVINEFYSVYVERMKGVEEFKTFVSRFAIIQKYASRIGLRPSWYDFQADISGASQAKALGFGKVFEQLYDKVISELEVRMEVVGEAGNEVNAAKRIADRMALAEEGWRVSGKEEFGDYIQMLRKAQVEFRGEEGFIAEEVRGNEGVYVASYYGFNTKNRFAAYYNKFSKLVLDEEDRRSVQLDEKEIIKIARSVFNGPVPNDQESGQYAGSSQYEDLRFKGKKYYELLGIARNATPDEIKLAYRRKAREQHPDVAEDKEAAHHLFIMIGEAKDVLTDPGMRREYDAWLSQSDPSEVVTVNDDPVDKASNASEVQGGIDLNSDNFDLEISGPAGAEIRFNLDKAAVEQLQNSSGLDPVIINITPLKDLPNFLGVLN